MKLLLIAEGHPREWPILEALSRHFPQTVWLKPIYQSSSKPSVFQKIGRLYYSLRHRIHWKVTKKKVTSPHFDEYRRVPWHEMTEQKGIELLDELRPDIILACRAPILPPEIIDKAAWGAINVHFGIIPQYRGNEGLFWSLLNKDYQALGGSIHRIDSGVDTGHKLVDAYPQLNGNESLIEIEVAVSRALAETLIKSLKKIEKVGQIPDGQPQQSTGRNYRQSERNWKKDLAYLFQKTGRSLPLQEKNIRFFF